MWFSISVRGELSTIWFRIRRAPQPSSPSGQTRARMEMIGVGQVAIGLNQQEIRVFLAGPAGWNGQPLPEQLPHDLATRERQRTTKTVRQFRGPVDAEGVVEAG